MLRTPVVTARGLADSLTVTPQVALGLLRQLIAVGVVREATGRALARLHHDIDHAVFGGGENPRINGAESVPE